MDIVLVGSGNVATQLGRKSLLAGHRIKQVYSRHLEHAFPLAVQLQCTAVNEIQLIERNADLIIIAISDSAVMNFMGTLGKTSTCAVHTAGALSIVALQAAGSSYGVVYPLQSLCKEIEMIPPLTLLVDGNNAASLRQIKEFAGSITETVIEANDESRLKYHLAATIVNNFSNHLFTLAENYCEKENISFALLQPLLEETVTRLRKFSPAQTQTGPALRNDLISLDKHRKLLAGYPEITDLYDLFSRQIHESYSKRKD